MYSKKTADDCAIAIRNNDLEKFRSTLVELVPKESDKNADIKKKDLNELLHIACRLGRVQMVDELLQNGADPNYKYSWENMRTPLHTIVCFGSLYVVAKKMAKLLLKYKADVNVRDGHGKSLLVDAIKNGYRKLIKLFWRHGLDLQMTVGTDKYTFTPEYTVDDTYKLLPHEYACSDKVFKNKKMISLLRKYTEKQKNKVEVCEL